MIIASSSVVVNDLDVPGRPFPPFETNAPLIVDTNTVLPAPIAVQGFEAIARQEAQIVEVFRRINSQKLRSCPALDLAR
jgi:hypothetical protein